MAYQAKVRIEWPSWAPLALAVLALWPSAAQTQASVVHVAAMEGQSDPPRTDLAKPSMPPRASFRIGTNDLRTQDFITAIALVCPANGDHPPAAEHSASQDRELSRHHASPRRAGVALFDTGVLCDPRMHLTLFLISRSVHRSTVRGMHATRRPLLPRTKSQPKASFIVSRSTFAKFLNAKAGLRLKRAMLAKGNEQGVAALLIPKVSYA